MLGLHLKFKDFARIGFAHHFHMDNYRQVYGSCYDSDGFELVYVKTGGVTARIYDKEYEIEPRSVIVLERNSLSVSLSVFSILSKLDNIYRQKLYSKNNTASLLEYKIKRYISDHMDKEIPLCDIADAIGKTPKQYLAGERCER